MYDDPEDPIMFPSGRVVNVRTGRAGDVVAQNFPTEVKVRYDGSGAVRWVDAERLAPEP